MSFISDCGKENTVGVFRQQLNYQQHWIWEKITTSSVKQQSWRKTYCTKNPKKLKNSDSLQPVIKNHNNKHMELYKFNTSCVILRIICRKEPEAAPCAPWPAVRTLLQPGPAVPVSTELPALPFHPQALRKGQKTKLALSKPAAATAENCSYYNNSSWLQGSTDWQEELEAGATRKTRPSRIFSSCKRESWQLFSSSPLSQMS